MQPITSLIGAPVARVEGPEKITGRTLYAGDVTLPGTLWGKILRSPHPHARIRRVDASAARQVPGVRAVITGQDVAGRLWGKVMQDMPVLCWDRVRFVGDRVAAAAEEAMQAIAVEYEELPAVFDPLEAMDEAAPLLHDDLASYDGTPLDRLAADVHNGQTRLAWTKGDPEQGFRESDRVFEHVFRIPTRHQGYLEPHATLVAIDADERIQVWTSTKAPFRARAQLARALGLSEDRIRVNVVAIGGDFGGKGDAMDAPIAYLLARQAGQPVRIVMTYAEELSASNPSHPTIITIRSGVSRDGRLLARAVRSVHACGAYAALKPNGLISAWHWAGSAYRVPHSSVEFLQVYTNTVPGGYFRGPGAHQYTFALESHTDIIAREMGFDPAEFRLMNLIEEGETDALGNQVRAIKARETLQAALDAAGWRGPLSLPTPQPGRRGWGGGLPLSPTRAAPARGRGIAIFGQQIGGGPGGAVISARPDGSLSLRIPTFDQGGGASTIMRQLAAAEMGVPLEQVRIEVADTDTAPFDDGPRASRVTYTEGSAVLESCRRLRERLREAAADLLDCAPADATYADGRFSTDSRSVGLAEVVAQAGQGRPVTVRAELTLPQPEDVMYFCAQVADVEVDPESGQVRVKRLVSAHDVGTIINPQTHQGQIDGGVATGVGLALTEELIVDEGRIANPQLGDYKMPCIRDVAPLETVLVPSSGGVGPHGAKPIGELANNGVPAAIANAVADAVDARLFELPITAERICLAREGSPAPGSPTSSS